MLKCVERKSNKVFGAERVSEDANTKWNILNSDGEVIKTVASSTFKRNYKLTGEVVASNSDEELSVEVAAPAIEKATRIASGKEYKVWLKTFTGMIIGADPYTATFDGKKYTVNTNKKGVQHFDKKGVQIGAKNPKFANRIEVIKK